jgi:hypothetical protein
MDNILKKQTTSIFRKPPEDVNSKFLWNAANQIMCYHNLDIMSIHQCEKLKHESRGQFIPENLNYTYRTMFLKT